jgi:hypothetical protein
MTVFLPAPAVAMCALAIAAPAQQMYTPMPPPPVPSTRACPPPAPPLWTYDGGATSGRPVDRPGDLGVADRLNHRERIENESGKVRPLPYYGPTPR